MQSPPLRERVQVQENECPRSVSASRAPVLVRGKGFEPSRFPTRTSNVRVCQFRHPRISVPAARGRGLNCLIIIPHSGAKVKASFCVSRAHRKIFLSYSGSGIFCEEALYAVYTFLRPRPGPGGSQRGGGVWSGVVFCGGAVPVPGRGSDPGPRHQLSPGGSSRDRHRRLGRGHCRPPGLPHL